MPPRAKDIVHNAVGISGSRVHVLGTKGVEPGGPQWPHTIRVTEALASRSSASRTMMLWRAE